MKFYEKIHKIFLFVCSYVHILFGPFLPRFIKFIFDKKLTRVIY
jgi:hypothetical protein